MLTNDIVSFEQPGPGVKLQILILLKRTTGNRQYDTTNDINLNY